MPDRQNLKKNILSDEMHQAVSESNLAVGVRQCRCSEDDFKAELGIMPDFTPDKHDS